MRATCYRESTIQDLYDIGRIVDVMEHIHFFQRAVVPRDIPDPYEMDFNTCYASVMSTTKHVGSSWVHPDHLVEASLEMLHAIAGGEQQMARAPVRQPVQLLRRAADEIRHRRLPLPGSGGARRHAGAAAVGRARPAPPRPPRWPGRWPRKWPRCWPDSSTSMPSSPGHPAIFGTWCFVSDLRTGAMSGGSPEQALLSSASGQMAHFYDLTGGTASGMTDSKIPDGQSGAEKALNHALVGNCRRRI